MRDPNAPFIAEDGLEYQDLGDFILGKPVDCWRNKTILDARKAGRSEESVRLWIKGYDGDDPTPSCQLTAKEQIVRKAVASVCLF